MCGRSGRFLGHGLDLMSIDRLFEVKVCEEEADEEGEEDRGREGGAMEMG